MISLKEYILENIDTENLVWKIETYFKKKPDQYKQFVNLVKKYQENYNLSDEDITSFLEKSKVDLKKFIDFISEDVTNENIDYMYTFKKVIQNIFDNKQIQL